MRSIVIIARGRKLVDGPRPQIKREFAGGTVALRSRGIRPGPPDPADRTLVASADDYGASAEVQLATGADPDRLLKTLVNEDSRTRPFRGRGAFTSRPFSSRRSEPTPPRAGQRGTPC